MSALCSNMMAQLSLDEVACLGENVLVSLCLLLGQLGFRSQNLKKCVVVNLV